MTDIANDVRIIDNSASHRFEAVLDGKVVGISQYSLANDVVTFLHTEVDPSMEGRGVGSKLASGVLDDTRRRGLKVVARCPFIAAYIARHREYADLLAE